MTPRLVLRGGAPWPFPGQLPFRQAQRLDGPNADLGRVLETSLTDLDDLLGNQFGERVVPILHANRAQGLFVSFGKPRDLLRPER